MPLDHPDREQLSRFLRDELDPEAQREIVRHLLRGCTHCVAATRSHWLAVAPAAGPVDDALAQARYRRRWGAAADTGRLRRGERAEAAAQLAALYELPPASRALRVALAPEMRSAALCRLLADDAGRLPPGDERRAMAEMAVAVAERLDVERYGTARVAALRAYSGGRLAAALLATGDLAGAEAALAAAEGSILGELGGSVEEAELLELRARLLCARKEFAKAEQVLADAVVVYRARGAASRLARALVRQGLVRARLRGGDALDAPIAAIALVRAGLERLDEEADPRFAACARHWLGLLHGEAGEIEAGLAALSEARELYRLAGDAANLARTAYAAGRLEAERGERQAAAQAWLMAERAFLDAGHGCEAAQVLLERTRLALAGGEPEAAREVAGPILAILRCRDLTVADAAALLFLRQRLDDARALGMLLPEILRFLADRTPAARPPAHCAL